MTTKRVKQICWSCAFFVTLGVFVLWLLSSCINTDMKDMKNIPPVQYTTPEPHKHNLTRGDIGYHFANQRGMNSVRILVPEDVQVLMLDSNFKEVDYFWYRKFNNWFAKLKHDNGIMPSSNQNMDCDNFAMLYKSLASVASYKAGVDHEPAVAVMLVYQHHEFGGVPGGSLHMVNLVFTSQGWYVFEPQSGEACLLEHYPNQEYVRLIIF